MQAEQMLGGVRVLDLSQYIPGPFATRQLADLGAEVVKIEPPGGDPMRRFMASGKDCVSQVYRHLNRGKRVCRLDLKSGEARDRLAGLLGGADILLESFRPGVLTRLGFDRQRLTSINARLIHCALSGFGHSGPYAKRAGHDINYSALSGQAIVSGTAERPVIGYPPIADNVSAMQAAFAMVAALYARGADGNRGTFIDLSITESLLAWQYLPMLEGAERRMESILNGGAACYNIYRCSDGRFISIGAIERHFWENFCAALGRPDWVDRQFEAMPQTALIAEVGEAFGTQGSGYWVELLDQVDCCFAPLLEPSELGRNPQLASRQAWSADGPACPVRVDGRAPATASDPTDIEPDDLPDWTKNNN